MLVVPFWKGDGVGGMAREKRMGSAISPAGRGAAIHGCHNPQTIMKLTSIKDKVHRLEQGKVGYILLWLLGIPLPVLLIIYLLQGGH